MNPTTPTEPSPNETQASEEAAPPITQEELDIAKAQMLAEQNFPLAVGAGILAALVGAVVWAAVTVITMYQIGYMAVGVGFLVGYAIRLAGKGITMPYSILGAVMAFLGCALGNLLSVCGIVAKEIEAPVLEVTWGVVTDPAAITELMGATFQPMDVLFYAIAIYEGYQLSLRKVTMEELKKLAA